MDDKLSEAIRKVSDFIIMLSDFDDDEEYKFNRALNKMLLDILSCGKYEIISFDQRKDANGKFVSHSVDTTLTIECIEWIRDNLDVWEVKELPDTTVDYEWRIYNRKFLFSRKGLTPPDFKELD
jgi:hypothetical protein